MSQSTNLFEVLVRNKARFSEIGGNLTAEDILDLPLQGAGQNLDALAQQLDKQIKAAGQESFVEKSKVPAILQAKFDFVIQIIEEKKAADQAAKDDAANKAQIKVLDEVIARKQKSDLEDTPVEELIAQRQALANKQ